MGFADFGSPGRADPAPLPGAGAENERPDRVTTDRASRILERETGSNPQPSASEGETERFSAAC